VPWGEESAPEGYVAARSRGEMERAALPILHGPATTGLSLYEARAIRSRTMSGPSIANSK